MDGLFLIRCVLFLMIHVWCLMYKLMKEHSRRGWHPMLLKNDVNQRKFHFLYFICSNSFESTKVIVVVCCWEEYIIVKMSFHLCSAWLSRSHYWIFWYIYTFPSVVILLDCSLLCAWWWKCYYLSSFPGLVFIRRWKMENERLYLRPSHWRHLIK